MRSIVILAIAACVVGVAAADAGAQTWNPLADSQRCPSKWGAGDQRGAANHMKPETVLRATRLIRTGQVFELGRRLEEAMPLQSTRTFELHTKRTAPLAGSNRRGSNEEIVLAEIGQVGTQFDGFAHQTIGDSLYNCFKIDDIATRNGFTKLGIENIGALMPRGVLLDIAGLKGGEMLPDPYEITVADLQQALQRQQLTLQPGDAVLLHTGWGRLWGKENDRYMRTNPGVDVAGSEWLARPDVVGISADTSPVHMSPGPAPKLVNSKHP